MALKQYAPAAIVVAIAAFVIWAFAATVRAHTDRMGLPLDDSYIYLTYAKQFGRAHPFTYFSGGGYSAGSTSALWPMVLAPFWTLGARGHALVWVSYLVGGVMFVLAGLGVLRVVRRVAGCAPVGAACAAMALSIGAFAFGALSGMEVGLASALLVAMLALVLDQPAGEPPSRMLAIVLAATSLSRPEATVIVVAIAGIGAIATWRATRWSLEAVRWLVPLLAPLAWVCANRALAGHWFPNTGVVKSHFYLPGFDWMYWRQTVLAQTGAMLRALFWSADSPLVWPRAIAVVLVIGALRAIVWSRRAHKPLVAAVAIGAPFALLLAVVATSGVGNAFEFQNYRYIATALPLFFVLVGFALAPPSGRMKPVWAATVVAVGIGFIVAGRHALVANMQLFAQGAMDTNTQVVAIGRFIHDKLPAGSRVMLHDAGAIAYYGDGPVFDMLGLVTNDQAGVANNGPGSRFEFLEHIPADQRPQYFAYYPGWLVGIGDFYGEPLLRTPLHPGFVANKRLVGDADMQLLPAVWDHVGTGEAPLTEHAGWAVVDAVDVADLASERAHAWTATLGRRRLGDPTARWSFVDRARMPIGLVIDGGRSIRRGEDGTASERFELDLDAQKPARLLVRVGGIVEVPFQERMAQVTKLEIFADDVAVGTLVIPAPGGPFVELAIELPKGARHIRTRADGTYRVFHWFALQPIMAPS
ncbi:MAG TPA: hypothetical protein VH143_15395 [Kofleriaceae bacterium]|nr:hypothetical protein [Kofleriaceae bacterium]